MRLQTFFTQLKSIHPKYYTGWFIRSTTLSLAWHIGFFKKNLLYLLKRLNKTFDDHTCPNFIIYSYVLCGVHTPSFSWPPSQSVYIKLHNDQHQAAERAGKVLYFWVTQKFRSPFRPHMGSHLLPSANRVTRGTCVAGQARNLENWCLELVLLLLLFVA